MPAGGVIKNAANGGLANGGGGGASRRSKASKSSSIAASSSSASSSSSLAPRASRKTSTATATSSSTTTTTAIIIQILILLCILYISISAYAFYGFHHHHHHHITTMTMTESSTTTTKTTREIKEKEEKDHQSSVKDALAASISASSPIAAASASSSTAASISSSSSSSFSLQANRQAAERLLQLEAQYASDTDSVTAAHDLLRKSNILTAHLEGPLHDTVPGTGNRGDVVHANKKGSNEGVPPEIITPLPLRTQSPLDLRIQQYPRLQTCRDLPAKFPVDRGLELTSYTTTDPETNETITVTEPVVWNVGDEPVSKTFVQDELPYCPVESDPYLPWIHDVFPSLDGTEIVFIAQNKRRCRTGVLFDDAVLRLAPQVALMQGISVVRLPNGEQEAKRLAPQLWSPSRATTTDTTSSTIDATTTTTTTTPRYRLVPIDEAIPGDGQLTRFICRFHTTDYTASTDSSTTTSTSRSIILGETLSQYPFNYELAAYRKGGNHAGAGLITPRGKDGKFFWASHLQFTCPVPQNAIFPNLPQIIAHGTSLLSDFTPTLFVDVIPIRTSVRYTDIHLTENMIGPRHTWRRPAFNATLHWGNNHVLPRVEASGRWANIPICLPPQAPPPLASSSSVDDVDENDSSSVVDDKNDNGKKENEKTINGSNNNTNNKNKNQKQHYLSACLWASAEFKTRGIKHGQGATTDTMDRLQEWLEFHFLVGFDHVYVYDNSGAHTNTTNLQPILSQYPASKVTWIDWPSIVCNNNIPAHDSTGERSSQYAAENSCRTRYAPFTTWIAAFDTDEYFVPMGNFTSLRQVLRQAQNQGTNILSFRSSRGRLRMDKSYHPPDGSSGGGDRRIQLPNATYLEAYNCDSAGSPKPEWADRARKQIYQTDYVLYHYVHYSTVTKGFVETYLDHINAGHSPESWSWNFAEWPPSERTVDEVNEAVLVHTKTIKAETTSGWTQRCQYDYKKKWQGCWVAFPWPAKKNDTTTTTTTIRSHAAISVPRAEKSLENSHDENGFEYNCFINERVDEYWVPRLRAALKKRNNK